MLQSPLITLPKTMLWKYFQSCMSCFRESWEINLTTWHTVPRFNQWLFIVSVGLKVLLQFVPWHGFPLLLNKECEIRLIPSQRSSSWFANFLYLFAIYSVKTKKKILPYIHFFISYICLSWNICSEFFLMQFYLSVIAC